MLSGKPTAADCARCDSWVHSFLTAGATPPFSFSYAGRPAAELLPGWTATVRQTAGSRTLCWTDPETGLAVELQAEAGGGDWGEFPAVEWELRFTNTGDKPTPILADIRPLDCYFADLGANAVLHWAQGSHCGIDDFTPRQATFYQPAARTISSAGRSSVEALPFFNVQSEGHGVIGGIGWTGSWQADFVREAEGLRLRAGMPRTHLSLQPGESISGPRLLLLFWAGERLHGHNLLRGHLVREHSPQVHGEAVAVPLCNAVWGEVRAAEQIAKARWWREHDLPLECFWIDAGWYGDGRFLENSTVFNSEWGAHAGNWWPNKGPYPEGLGPVGQALAEMGLGFVLWLEPERAFHGTYFTREHPEWLLGPVGPNYLFNLGLPEARAALTDLISGIIEEAHVTCYRQDFNMEPQPFWEAADAPDRIGMSEIRHIEGLYAMWDELRERHPGLLIDNCASGGRRLDLQTASRSVPLWRSDFQCYPGFDPVGLQCQTHGLSLWLPLSAGVCDRSDTYAFRSGLSAGLVLTANIYEQETLAATSPDWLRKMMGEHLRLRPFFSGDFYPLQPFSHENEAWAAWQFDRPDLGAGCVIAFRRPESPLVELTAQLRGLEASAVYAVEDLDTGAVAELCGAELAQGLPVRIGERPGTKLLAYRRV